MGKNGRLGAREEGTPAIVFLRLVKPGKNCTRENFSCQFFTISTNSIPAKIKGLTLR